MTTEFSDPPVSPKRSLPKRGAIALLVLLGVGVISAFFALLLLLDSSDPPDEGSDADPAAPADVRDTDTETADGATDPADRPSTTLPIGVPSEMVGRWIQVRQIDPRTDAAVDVVIGEALRLDIAADGTFTQQLGEADATDPQILRAIQEGDDLQVLVYADAATLAAGEHRLAADVELDDDTMAWTFGEESTLVFERD